jgi:cytochrome c
MSIRQSMGGLVLLSGMGAAIAAHAQAAPQPQQGDPARGKILYQSCMGCHSLDDNDVGPMHRGVVGRKAGTVPDYAYSNALKASGIVWDPASLDRWLTNPQALVPGAKMYFSIPDAQKRADIISYLATQK